MSFKMYKNIEFVQPLLNEDQIVSNGPSFQSSQTFGGILSDLKHVWHARGPCLEIRNTQLGKKVGAWTFGGPVRDTELAIVGVDEVKRHNGKLPLLIIALQCSIRGGLICVFDIFSSKVVRVVHIEEQITTVHVIDGGSENSLIPESSPLKYFDGILVLGTCGGNVYLLDICRQICEEALYNDPKIMDEVNLAKIIVLPKAKFASIKKYVEKSLQNGEHLAIHLNAVDNSSTEHFTLKGEKGDDRVYVNKTEAEISSAYYSPQIGSLLIGYNFGAFQLWDLSTLELTYTSPVCEDHIPVTHFTLQEPADDPKAYCYVWVSYSHSWTYHSGVPYAVMYSFYYNTKKFVYGCGYLYQNFQHCSVRFQIELGTATNSTFKNRLKGGTCLGLQTINRHSVNRDVNSLSLCLISWIVWDTSKEVESCVLLFDLNQWYKEQMPSVPNWSDCSNYIIKHGLQMSLLDVKLDQKSLSQFVGVQRLEEHFCPTSLTFDLVCLTKTNLVTIHNKSCQQAFIDKLEEQGHLSLVRPQEYIQQIVSLGLTPLFCEITPGSSNAPEFERDIILNVALEQKMIGWLCNCTVKLANDAYNSSGLTIDQLVNWAFQRATKLKTACDNYCTSLFDYSGIKLDNNIINLVSNSAGQIKNVCSFYQFISKKLLRNVCDKDAFYEELLCLKNVTVYFEVLLWMVNVDLLPECAYRKLEGSVGSPYRVHELTQYYARKRAHLQQVSYETFVEKDCLLFIDNLINNKPNVEALRQQWQEDGGSGLYPLPSLQSVLRVYLFAGTDLVFKHSLVTYTLLDAAMTLDEQSKIIKSLLKFPHVFDLSQSTIKIIQAFWHLDHDDYQTALDYILDPCILPEDLQQWHHSVMMRSLLLQEQYNLALLYLQIRKPSITDEKDLFTVLSLLISKNMLNEAFQFQQRHAFNDDTLLMHIYNECNKNEMLHSLLYRCLNVDEEQAFFKYLKTARSSKSEDLKICYYLLRSRFLEAFDAYTVGKKKTPESQGLIGQRDATTIDNVVKLFKNLLPDVNKALVDVVRKERSNLWREIQRPTPLSVFVHNASEKIHYKSGLIFAALTKAKRTFYDSNQTLVKDVTTEETPFLRTPTAFKQKFKPSTPIMNVKLIDESTYGPSPCKRLRLTPRAPTASPPKTPTLSHSMIHSKMLTPIVRRKLSIEDASNFNTSMPQSILKNSRSNSMGDTLTVQLESKKLTPSLTPRKPLSRTPLKTHVKFDDVRYSSSSTDLTKSGTDVSKSTTSDINEEEAFYSPNNSPIKSPSQKEEAQPVEESKVDKDVKVMNDPLIYQSPRARRSYKRSLGETLPVRSSPRLSRSLKKSTEETSKSEITCESSEVVKQTPSEKLMGRKSLSRSVLEQGCYSETSKNEITCANPEVVKQTPSEKLKGRKSISRSVLEQNTFRQTCYSRSFLSSANTSFNDSEYSESDNSLYEILNTFNSDLKKKVSESLTEGAKGEQELCSKPDDTKPDFSFENSIYSTPELKDKFEPPQEVNIEDTSENDQGSSNAESPNCTGNEKAGGWSQPSPSVAIQKTRGRRSLVRTVLEHNTFKQSGYFFEKEEICSSENTSFNDSECVESDDSLIDYLKEFKKGHTDFVQCDSEAVDTQTRGDQQENELKKPDPDEQQITSMIYDDLSSCSDDPRNEESEEEKSSEDSVRQKSEEVPITEQAFLDEVIEIGSSDDEEQQKTSSSSEASKSSKSSVASDEDAHRDHTSSDESLKLNHSTDSERSLNNSDDSSSEQSMKNEEEYMDCLFIQDDDENLKEGNEVIVEEDVVVNQTEGNCEVIKEDRLEEPKLTEVEQNVIEDKQDLEEPKLAEDKQDLKEPTHNDDKQDLEEPKLTEDEQNVIEDKQELEEPKPAEDKQDLDELTEDKQDLEEPKLTDFEQNLEESKLIEDKQYLEEQPNRQDIGDEPKVTKDKQDLEEPKRADDKQDSVEAPVVSEKFVLTHENVEKMSKSVQCAVNETNQDMKSTPNLVLRTVKRTYPKRSRLNSALGETNISTDDTVDKTPKLVVKLVRRTYQRNKVETETSSNDRTESSEKEEGDDATSNENNVKQTSENEQKQATVDEIQEDPVQTAESAKNEIKDTNESSKNEQKEDTVIESRGGRVTRRLSQLSDRSVLSETLENIQNETLDSSKIKTKTRSKKLSESSQTSEIKETTRQSQPKKRVRSVSVDQPVVLRQRSLRSKSVEGAEENSEALSKTSLPPIREIDSSEPATQIRKAKSHIGTYTTTRRLTRKQAAMFRGVDDTTLNVEEMDPIQLLDKPQFQGQKDPDELKVYEETSSPSNSTISGMNLRNRSVSVTSDVTTDKKTKVKSSKGIKGRLRSVSMDSEPVVTESPDSPSPTKKTKKKEDTPEADEIAPRMTRSRAHSVSSSKSDKSDTTSVSGSRRKWLHSKQNELPEIKEEQTTGDDKDEVKKRGRKRK